MQRRRACICGHGTFRSRHTLLHFSIQPFRPYRTIENSSYMGEGGRYKIVTIDRTLAPRDRYDRTAGGALYYLKYD